jgi:Na+/phosphate symporter
VNKNTKDKLLKIDEKKDISIFEKFENLLSIIIYKGDIDKTNYEKLEAIVKELNYEQIPSIDLVNQYFANIYKYLPNENYLEKNYTENLCQLNIIIYETIEEIQKELKQTHKNQNDKKVKSDSKFEKLKKKLKEILGIK